MRVIDTDNFGGDYPNEKFVGPIMTEDHAKAVAKALNDGFHLDHPRFFKVVPDDYKLQPGFAP